jgi:hypothetical protein
MGREASFSCSFGTFEVGGEFGTVSGFMLGVVLVASVTRVAGAVVLVMSGGGFSAGGTDGVDAVVCPVSNFRVAESFAFSAGGGRVKVVPHSPGLGGDGFRLICSMNASSRCTDSSSSGCRFTGASITDVGNGRGR